MKFLLFRYFKIIKNICELMRMLLPLCVLLAYASGTDAFMSIRVRNLCVHRALSNEHTHQILMPALSKGSLIMLSIRIRN